jgi:hypothetical protein
LYGGTYWFLFYGYSSGAKLLKVTFVEMKIKERYFARWENWLVWKVYLQAYEAEEQAANYDRV